jgi:hypothetical protein
MSFFSIMIVKQKTVKWRTALLGPSPWSDGADYRIRKCRATHLETKKDDNKNWQIEISLWQFLTYERQSHEADIVFKCLQSLIRTFCISANRAEIPFLLEGKLLSVNHKVLILHCGGGIYDTTKQ